MPQAEVWLSPMSALMRMTDLVVQGIEPIAGFCLRFRVQRLLQFLNSFRS